MDSKIKLSRLYYYSYEISVNSSKGGTLKYLVLVDQAMRPSTRIVDG